MARPKPKAKAAAKKQASGGARMKASGKSPVLIGLDPDQRELLKAAADREGKPLTQFILRHAIAAAKKILRKSATKG